MNLSYSIVNIIGGKNLRALRRLNKGRKYNSNTFKDRNNRAKRLALLGKCWYSLTTCRIHISQ